MLYKFISEARVQKCPQNGHINGRAISNLPRYFEIHPGLAAQNSYKPLHVDQQPDYNVESQFLSAIYENTDEAIIQHWIINDIPEEGPNLEQRVADVEDQISAAKIVLGVK